METSSRQFSAAPASLSLTGTCLLPSQPSSGRPEILPGSLPRDTDSDDDYTAVTASELDDSTRVSFMFVGSVQDYFLFLFSLSPPFYVEGTSLTTLFATRTRVLESASL
jgi:hypothetical protein